MDFGDFLEAIRREGDALAAAAHQGLDADVVSCPGWTVRDVVGHTGMVHRHKEQIVREGWVDGQPEPVPIPEDDLVAWYENGLDRMLETLASHDPAERAWTWDENDQTVGFWYRRMAHETLIHRVDAESGHGAHGAIDPALAVDGIDELVMSFLTGLPEWLTATPLARCLSIETSAPSSSWRLRAITFSGTSPHTGNVYEDEPAFEVDREDAVPDATVRGSGRDVLLWMWGRGPLDRLDVSGDASLVADLRRQARDATQ